MSETTSPNPNGGAMQNTESAGSAENVGFLGKSLSRLNPREIAVLRIPGEGGQPVTVMDATDKDFDAFVTATGVAIGGLDTSEWSFDDRCRFINFCRKHGVQLQFAQPGTNKNSSESEQKTIRQDGNEQALQALVSISDNELLKGIGEVCETVLSKQEYKQSSENILAVHLHADKDLKPETVEALGKLAEAAYKAAQKGTLGTAICEGCGAERSFDNWAINTTKVNLRDGTSREILFCDQPCCEFWDDTEPGEWVELASGEEVQQADWKCEICDGVFDHDMVKLMIDTDYEEETTAIVCGFCRKKEKNRFKVKS